VGRAKHTHGRARNFESSPRKGWVSKFRARVCVYFASPTNRHGHNRPFLQFSAWWPGLCMAVKSHKMQWASLHFFEKKSNHASCRWAKDEPFLSLYVLWFLEKFLTLHQEALARSTKAENGNPNPLLNHTKGADPWESFEQNVQSDYCTSIGVVKVCHSVVITDTQIATWNSSRLPP